MTLEIFKGARSRLTLRNDTKLYFQKGFHLTWGTISSREIVHRIKAYVT